MARLSDGPVASTNLDGLTVLTEDQAIPFVAYQRYVLPLDGFVFWLRTTSTEVRGSLHITADKRQDEDESPSVNRVLFTTGEMVQAFNNIEPNQIWVGEAAGVRFAFSQSGPRFKVSGLFHYGGTAVYPALEAQLIDVGAQLPTDRLVVSNSLPAWLGLKTYNPVWLNAPNPGLTLYPSFLVPENLRPPYGTVHIAPDATRALQAFPNLGRETASQHQLASDRVRITLYGLTNDQALDFANLVLQFSEDTDTIGLMNMPIVRDEKKTQPELGIIAMKKSIEFEVSYVQARIRDLARALIEEATATILPPG